MIRVIMKKEILEQFYSLKFTSILVICSVLIILSLYTGAANYNLEQGEYETTQTLARTELEGYSSYGDIGMQGVKVPKKPSPLSLIATGVQGTLAKFATVRTMGGQPSLGPSKFAENPIFTVFGDLDLTFIVKVALSLLTIMLTYDAISGEQERGTLKLILANSIPRVHVILAKMISLFLCLLIALLLPTLVGLLIVFNVFEVHFTGEEWLRMGFIFGVSGLYLLLMFALGMFVSARTQRSSVSLLLLLLFWVIFVSVIPRTAVIVAEQLRPTPAYSQIQSKMEANQRARIQEYTAQIRELMRSVQLGKGNIEAFQEKMESLRREMQKNIEESNTKIMESYNRRKANLTQLAMNFSRVSPTSALSYAAMGLAGTGLRSHQHFLSDLKAYRKGLDQYIRERGGDSYLQMVQRFMTGETPKPGLDLSGLPVFREHPETLVETMEQVLPDMVLLVAEAVVLLMLAFLSFVQYEVR